jgi:hypothetical protein
LRQSLVPRIKQQLNGLDGDARYELAAAEFGKDGSTPEELMEALYAGLQSVEGSVRTAA